MITIILLMFGHNLPELAVIVETGDEVVRGVWKTVVSTDDCEVEVVNTTSVIASTDD